MRYSNASSGVTQLDAGDSSSSEFSDSSGFEHFDHSASASIIKGRDMQLYKFAFLLKAPRTKISDNEMQAVLSFHEAPQTGSWVRFS